MLCRGVPLHSIIGASSDLRSFPRPRRRGQGRAWRWSTAPWWKALAASSGPVALKQLLPRFSRNAEGIALFVEEARVSARLDHPHIVQVYEFGQDRRGKPFLVMEWVEGLDLATWLNAHESVEPSDWAVVCALGCEGARRARLCPPPRGRRRPARPRSCIGTSARGTSCSACMDTRSSPTSGSRARWTERG